FRVAPRARSRCPSPPILRFFPSCARVRRRPGLWLVRPCPARPEVSSSRSGRRFSGPWVWCRRRWVRAGFSAPDAYPDPPPATHPVARAHRVVSFGRLIRRVGSAFVRRSALSDASSCFISLS
uniref:Uncharacterized protein n=1 Tax=Aegilops tauschii subsp. strangulata TaxID=200361 RepID=A0A453LGJ4_AEGTS